MYTKKSAIYKCMAIGILFCTIKIKLITRVFPRIILEIVYEIYWFSSLNVIRNLKI